MGNRRFKDLLEASMKSKDTEEWLDVHFTRPIGLFFALIWERLGVHPNTITIISIFLVLFVLPQILLIGTRIVDRTSFAVPKLVARSSGNGRMRVNGIVQGEIHGSVAGTMNAIVDGDVQLTVISGNVSQELDDNKQQEVQNEDQ